MSNANAEPAGWLARDWCAGVSISRASLYRLSTEQQPHSVKVGSRRIIRESPSAWLERIAQRGQSCR